ASFWKMTGAVMLHGEHRYVSDFGPQAIERPTDLDGRTHKKTGHKMSTITHRAIQSRRRRISP
ncbi:MAG: hypothetical protein U0934_08980, partial [Pseudotabrizicola sp.]|uniref:hypothetical protein n=1 Tax=Pseudotabrizicola sp. TaxID=2939647 RepID=UPI002ACD6C19